MAELQTFLGVIYAKPYIKNKYQKLSDEITERFTQNKFICKFSKKSSTFYQTRSGPKANPSIQTRHDLSYRILNYFI